MLQNLLGVLVSPWNALRWMKASVGQRQQMNQHEQHEKRRDGKKGQSPARGE